MTQRTLAKRAEQQIDLEDGIPGKLTSTAIHLKAGLSFQKWTEVGVLLGRISASMQWWIAGWVCYGEDKFGERFAQALESTGRDPKSLLTWVRVHRSVAEGRRREELTFSHHEAVSALDPDDQAFWLQKAIDGDKLPNGEVEMWSSRRLRAELAKLGKPAEDPDPEIIVEDKAKVPLDYLVVDVKQVREAWHAGKREIDGLKLLPPAVVQQELVEA
jgi:hypothetical protein